MPGTRWLWSHVADIPSEAAAGRPVVEQLIQQMEKHRWPEHDVFAVHLAVQEALVNAIKHGNRHDATKRVHLCLKLNRRRVIIEISDEGAGFCPDDVPDPTAVENLERPCGRGLLLMRNFMTRVHFSGPGNRLVMEKVRSRPQIEAAGCDERS